MANPATLISSRVLFEFGPRLESDQIPLQPILYSWLRNKFDPVQCEKSFFEIMSQVPEWESYVNKDAFRTGGYLFTDRLYFPALIGWNMRVSTVGTNLFSVNRPVPIEQVPTFAQFLRWALVTDDAAKLRKRLENLLPAPLVDLCLDRSNDPPHLEWMQDSEPGVYRRDHAALVVRSRTTSILIDPATLQRQLTDLNSAPVRGSPASYDAVLISHSHADHWHLPSLLSVVGDPDTPVVVPKMDRPNSLTGVPFKDVLNAIGQKALDPEWGSSIRIGDIEIDILPFYGEQPVRDAPATKTGVRSIGNCYRINTPEFSVVVLVDSGADPAGAMDEVVAESSRRRGAPDLVLSCLREFSSPFFGGLTGYWSAVSFSRLQELYREFASGVLPSTTAGPKGVAEVLTKSGAHAFAPYADGFEGVGERITDVGWGQGEPSEEVVMDRVATALRDRGGVSKLIEWNPGDHLLWRNGSFELRKYAHSREDL